MERFYSLLTFLCCTVFIGANGLAQVSTNGLVAHYKMDGDAQDASGNGNHGTAQNGVAFGTGKFGKAASFDGVNDYVEVNHSASLNNYVITGELTISYWINPDIGKTRDVIAKRPPANNGGFVVQANPDQMGYDHAIFTNVGQKYVVVTYTQNEWQHIVFSAKAGDAIRVFKNGVLSASLSLAGNTFVGTTNNMRLMANTMALELFQKGQLDQVQIFSRILSNDEVQALYQAEAPPAGISLSSPLKFAGGLTNLEQNKAYSYNFEVKNTGTVALIGEVVMRVGAIGVYTLITPSSTYNAGASTGLSGMFTPTAAQIGNQVPIELFFKKSGSTTHESLGVLNGAKNPSKVNIIAPLQEPVLRESFISLSQQEIDPGQSVVLTGSNFIQGQNIRLEVFPTISGFSYSGITVATDGSFKTTLSFPATTKEETVTINVSNGQGSGTGKTLLINQPQDVAELKITKPTVAGQPILIQPRGYVLVELSDKLIPKSNYPLTGSSRSYRYEIGFRYGGGTVDFPLLTTDIEKGFVNNPIQKSYLVKMEAFTTISSPEGWPIQYYVKDLYDNTRKVYSPTINLVIVNQLSKIDLKWDASLPFEPVSAPKGIAADGTSRMYLLAEKVSAGGSPISNLAVQLTSYESNQNNTLNNTSWLGKVMYASSQTTVNYSEEANAANSTAAVKLTPNSNGKYYFWYVAPEDFTVPGIPALYSLDNANERTVFAKFTITYADNTTEILTKEISVIRPPLMLVHGLSGDEHSWDKFKLKNESLWKLPPKAVRMLPDAEFITNGLGLVNHIFSGVSYESSFQSILTTYRAEGWVANKVDYVCHSMGGLMLRALVEEFPELYYTGSQSVGNIKNYGKGFVNKFITINTPHNGSPVADLMTFAAPKFPIWLRTALTANYIGTKFDSGLNLLNSFVVPINEKIRSNGSVLYDFKTTGAVRNLMTNNFGIVPDGYRFKETNLKSHLISSDVFKGNLLPDDQFMQQLLIIESCRLTFELGKTFLSVREYYKHAKKIGTAKNFNIADYQAYFNKLGTDLRNEILEPAVLNQLWISFESQYCTPLAIDDSDYLRSMNQYFNVYGNWNQKYSDFMYNGDWIVPLLSQTANKVDNGYLNDNVTTLFPIEPDNVLTLWNNARFNHVFITDIDETRFEVKRLLNSSINSPLFDKIPANNNPIPKVYVPTASSVLAEKKTNTSKNVSTNTSLDKPLIEKFNRNKVAIVSPSPNSNFENSDNVMVKVTVTDTVKLVSCKVVVGSDLKEINQRNYNYNFVIKPTLIPNSRNMLLAAATYSYADSVVILYDSVSIVANSTEQAIKLIAKPKNYEIGVGQSLNPTVTLIYSSYTRSPLKDNKLTVEVENPNALEWNNEFKTFIGKKRGESKVVFNYQGLKDSVFVKIDKGGVTLVNTLTTSTISSTSVCQGGVISVPYTMSGTFENDNAFLVQMAPNNSLDFQTLSKMGNGNPQLVRIPNNTPAGTGYKIRVTSTNVPLIGNTSPTSITITSFAAPPTVTTNKVEFKAGESVTLTATGCTQTVEWSTGQTGNSITITPTESGVYKATCTNIACTSVDSEPIIINKYLCVPSIEKSGETITGENTELAGTSITSTEKIKGNGTKMTYEAPTITLNPGFGTESGVIFKVQIGGCN